MQQQYDHTQIIQDLTEIQQSQEQKAAAKTSLQVNRLHSQMLDVISESPDDQLRERLNEWKESLTQIIG